MHGVDLVLGAVVGAAPGDQQASVGAGGADDLVFIAHGNVGMAVGVHHDEGVADLVAGEHAAVHHHQRATGAAPTRHVATRAI
ncbi:hypothetical protein SDC9_198648 [bioreactor metagenome]|uniref:Uncharacterized protein n=1 Tax=bioreactor metagenome TaxID=1076179 RepID=A0A645II79_9ZZZZ